MIGYESYFNWTRATVPCRYGPRGGMALVPVDSSRTIPSLIALTLLIGLTFVSSAVAQISPIRNLLWDVVHSWCVPGQQLSSNPAPCAKVDLSDGVGRGFAVIFSPF